MKNSTPRIAVDVTPLLYTANGIGRSTRSLVDAILHSPKSANLDFILFGRRLGGSSLASHGLKGRCVHLRLPRKAETLIRRLGLVDLSCRADLYHATDFYIPLKHPERAIATVHDVIFLRKPEPMVDHARLGRWAREFARSSRAIITCSNWCRQDISNTMQVDPAKIHVIYWGVDRSVFSPEPDKELLRHRLQKSLGITRPYFLAVSCSMERKNTPRLLSAYAELLKHGAQNDLVVVWDPPEELRTRYAKEQSSGRIRFVGRQTDASLRDLYCGATAMLYPSFDEGFGLPVVEAMTCGTPVITSNRTCLPEIADGAAVLVDPNDQDAVTQSMELFENKSAAVEDLAHRGLRRSQAFSWAQCAEQTLGVYRSVLNGMAGTALE